MSVKKCGAEDKVEIPMINNKTGGNVKKYLVILSIIAISLIAVGLQAQMAPKMMGMADELKLTDAQKKQMQASMIAEQKDLVQLRAEVAKAKIEMKEIMMSDNIDKAAALKKIDQIASAKAAIAKRSLSGKIDRMNILTPEQRKNCPMPMMGRGKCGPKGCCGEGMRGGMREGRGPEKGHGCNMGEKSEEKEE
jgi:hypothetical protein